MSTYTIPILEIPANKFTEGTGTGFQPIPTFLPSNMVQFPAGFVTSLILKMMNIHNFVQNLNLQKLAANEHGIYIGFSPNMGEHVWFPSHGLMWIHHIHRNGQRWAARCLVVLLPIQTNLRHQISCDSSYVGKFCWTLQEISWNLCPDVSCRPE